MKTKALLAGIVMATMTVTSCSNSGSGIPEAKAPATFADSVAMYQGIFAGAQSLETIGIMPDSVKAKFDKEKFLAGMKLILQADTSINFQDGVQMAMQILGNVYQAKAAGIDLNPDVILAYFAQTFRADSVNHEELKEMGPEMESVMMKYQEKLEDFQYGQQKLQEARMQQMFETNVVAGKKFIEDAKAKDSEIKTTDTGLSYKVIKQGTGAVAKDGEDVKVIFTGKLPDGSVFDSSNNQVVDFNVDQVIPGFKEALKMFPAGSKVELYVPQELGYGMYGSRVVAPGQTMIFDLEIVEK